MTKRKANPRWRARRPDIDTKVIVSRYEAGESGPAIASFFKCSVRTVFMRLAAAGVTARPVGKAAKASGEKSATWKGSDASYSGFHQRVSRVRGAPKRCSRCGITDPNKRYDWANLTGNFGDTTDYSRMCRSCHKTFDMARIRAKKTAHADAERRALAGWKQTVEALQNGEKP